VPVVLPDASAFPEIVAATGGGKLFALSPSESRNAELLADALQSLLTSPREAAALGAQGRAAVRRDFSSPQFAARLVAETRERIDAPQPVS